MWQDLLLPLSFRECGTCFDHASKQACCNTFSLMRTVNRHFPVTRMTVPPIIYAASTQPLSARKNYNCGGFYMNKHFGMLSHHGKSIRGSLQTHVRSLVFTTPPVASDILECPTMTHTIARARLVLPSMLGRTGEEKTEHAQLLGRSFFAHLLRRSAMPLSAQVP